LSAVLGLDTATDDVAVAAVRGDEILHESLLGRGEEGGPRHATALLGEVERAVAAAGGWEEIERIAVGVGPGSFTGVRVGIASARGLALSRGLPVGGVCTLDALAAGIGEAAAERDRLAVGDARRGEVFAALYSPAGERLWGPLVSTPEELAARAAMGRPVLGAGSGAVRFRQKLASQNVEIPDDAESVHRIAARHVCALAATGAGDAEAGSVAPIYLRAPDAERWRERGTLQKAE
jgi:tRNA threonylcarbamoyladenosine biosynthesis protein TsaB